GTAMAASAEVARSGMPGLTRAALFPENRSMLRAVDPQIYSVSRQASSTRNGRRRNRAVFDGLGGARARGCQHAESGVERVVVSVSTGASDRVAKDRRGARQATQTAARRAVSPGSAGRASAGQRSSRGFSPHGPAALWLRLAVDRVLPTAGQR